MIDNIIAILDWLGVIAFAITGALVASRQQMDIIGFMLLGSVTGIGGGTIRDILLGLPVFWVVSPEYLAVCILVSVIVFLSAHLVSSRMKLILWVDAIGLALYATVGAERALATGASALVAVVMGVITACFGGIIRDLLAHERSIIFSREIYVTCAVVSATIFIGCNAIGLKREATIGLGLLSGFALRAGAILKGWSLPRYRARPPHE